jgi:hypothetical protein
VIPWSSVFFQAVHVSEHKVCLFVILTMLPAARIVELARELT